MNILVCLKYRRFRLNAATLNALVLLNLKLQIAERKTHLCDIFILKQSRDFHAFKFYKETCLFVTHFCIKPALRAADFICLDSPIFRLLLSAFLSFVQTSDDIGQNLFYNAGKKMLNLIFWYQLETVNVLFVLNRISVV